MKEFINSLTDYQVSVILEAARIGLADSRIASQVSFNIGVSDADINGLQHKIHMFMEVR